MPSTNYSFKQVNHIGDTYLMNKLEVNLKTWFDWALLRAGGWTNVSIPLPGAYGGDFSTLRQVDDPSYTAGTVWESVRKDWVWETGVDYVGTDTVTYNPTSPAVVQVDSVVTAPDHINYPLGRVIFATPISSSSTVQAQYSYRYAQVYRADDVPWWNELQYRSFRPDDVQFTELEDGSWSVGSQHRFQMPCVIIEAVPRSMSRPYQLGDGAAWVEQDVLVHVLAENRNDRNKLVDIFRGQFDASIDLFDNDAIAAADAYPLDYRGEIVDSSQTYPALVNPDTGYVWNQSSVRFSRTEVAEVESLNSRLFEGVVRMTCEIILND